MLRSNMSQNPESADWVTIIVVLCCSVSQSVKHNLLAAFRHLLRPLVRVATRNGVEFPEFTSAVRDAYVKVAAAELRVSGGEISAAAISVITGIQQEEIREVLRSPDDVKLADVDQRINAAVRVLLGWHTDRDYIGPYGLVRDLGFSSSEGKSKKDVSGFVDLARQYCPGVPPKVLLDELIRTGCVQDLGNGFYRALTRSYVPEQLSAESIRRFAEVVHNVTETLEVNLRRSVRGTGRIERTIWADYGLRPHDLAAFDKYLRERGQLFADDIDNWLSDRSQEGYADAIQTGIGFYHYVVNNDDERDFGRALQIEGIEDEKQTGMRGQ
jgi:hypothetical protein